MHRDIKPANIFLCRYGEEYDFVKVLDFGIVERSATTRTPATDRRPGRTRSRARRRSSRPSRRWERAVDGRADIYATGCVAYWLLTGQYVFTADTPMGLLLQHAQTPPTPPSARTEPADSPGARGAGAVLPGQGSGGAAAVGPGAVGSAGRDRGRRRLDPGAGAGMVGGAPAGEALDGRVLMIRRVTTRTRSTTP